VGDLSGNGAAAFGFGRMPRKEDDRLIRGQGRFVDDVQLPGMLHGAILRSPLAHARILSMDTSAALAHPRVHAVLTGVDLEARGCAWMPTLSADTQAVLATDKVRFQGQEVAFVVADDRYSARDALELVEVDYEPLPVVVDPRRALDPDAPVIRDDHPGRGDNRIFDWETGDAAATDRAFQSAEVVVDQEMVFPRSHPAPLETCGAVADFDRATGDYTLYTTTQNPHVIRLLMGAFVLQIPESKLRVVAPDVGGGFGSKIFHYAEEAILTWAAGKLARPIKWTAERRQFTDDLAKLAAGCGGGECRTGSNRRRHWPTAVCA